MGEFRPYITLKDIARGTARVGLTLALLHGGIGPVEAGGGTPPNNCKEAASHEGQLFPGESPLRWQPAYVPTIFQPGETVWERTNELVTNAEKDQNLKLSNEQHLQAVNAIKNLAVCKNGTDLNLISAWGTIDYLSSGAIRLIVQNLSTTSLTDTQDIVLRQGLDIIANPPTNDFLGNSSLVAEANQVSSLLQLKMTLDQPHLVQPPEQKKAQLDIDITCSTAPAYGMLDMGLHGQISVEGKNLSQLKTRLNGGTWLYVGKTDALFPAEDIEPTPVGYSSDSDSFTANMDGFINPIRDFEPRVKPITFRPGDKVRIILKRGPYTQYLPEAEQLIEWTIPIDCSPRSEKNTKQGI